MLLFGTILIIIGLLFVQWCATNYLRSPISRPLVFHSTVFLIASLIIPVILVLGGFFLAFKSSITFSFILLGIVMFIFLLLKRGSSTKATKDAMYKTYYKVKKFHPISNINLNEKEKIEREKSILLQTLEPRYRYFGKYDMETLESIVDEYPDIESLTNFVILFEFYEHQYPRIDIAELRKYVRDSFKMIKEHNIDIEDHMKNYGKYIQ